MEDIVPPTKKAKLGPDQDVSGQNTLSENQLESGASINGVHDVPGPSSSSSNGPFDLPGGISNAQPEDDDDNISILSGISDMSGKGWKPDCTGELAWLARARSRGINPRDIISDLMQGGDTAMLESMDDGTIWMILFKMFAQPPKRQKLKDFNSIEDLVRHIKEARRILVLTGAGVSVSCGIPDFRSKDGVYARLAVDFPDLPDPQAMFDIQYFRKDPRPFFKFAKEIYPGQFTPSPCHRFIQCLEREGKLLRNYTQNIDTLEQVAGISRVVQCHGSFATASCTLCKQKQEAHTIREDIMQQKIPLCSICPSPDLQEILERLEKQQEERKEAERKRREGTTESTSSTLADAESCTSCCTMATTSESSSPTPTFAPSVGGTEPTPNPTSSVEGAENKPSSTNPSNSLPVKSMPLLEPVSPFSNVPIMKPDIVFFGEGLSDQFHKTIAEDKDEVDLLIVVGSSLKVRPVALIPSSIPKHIPQVLINRERLAHMTFDVELLGDCDVIINQLCHMLEGDWSPGIHKPILEQTQVIPPPTLNKEDPSENSTNEAKDASENKVDTAEEKPANDTNEKSPKETSAAECSKEDKDEKSGNDLSAAATPDKDSTNGDNENDNSEDGEGGDWKPKSLAESLPAHQFLHIPPHRYIFHGAEVYAEDLSDSEDEMGDDEESDQEQDELETGHDESVPSSSQPMQEGQSAAGQQIAGQSIDEQHADGDAGSGQ